MSNSTTLAFDLKAFLAIVGRGITISSHKEGGVIFAQGDPGDAVFLVQNGQVKLTVVSARGKEAIIAFFGPGDFIGEGCLGSRTRRISTASATADCVIVRVEKSTMIQTLRDQPKFAERFISHLLARSIRLEEDLIDQLFNSSEKRLARTLLLIAHDGIKDGSDRIVPKVSQATLAEIIGTTRSRVSHFMAKFRRLGLIDYDGVLKVHPSLLELVRQEDPQMSSKLKVRKTKKRHV